jgi:hypothetical protein
VLVTWFAVVALSQLVAFVGLVVAAGLSLARSPGRPDQEAIRAHLDELTTSPQVFLAIGLFSLLCFGVAAIVGARRSGEAVVDRLRLRATGVSAVTLGAVLLGVLGVSPENGASPR